MVRLKKFILNEYVLVFLFCFAAIQGPAFSLMDNFDQSSCIDCQTFTGLANMDLDQSPVRRYRPIVPILAGAVNYVFGGVFELIHPISFPGDFSLSLSFLLVNTVLLSLWGVVIYRFTRAYDIDPVWSLAGLAVLITSRWTPYIAGTPIADSIYCLITGTTLLGIKERNERLIVLSIFAGPFAKEAFIFIAPVIFFFSHVGKKKQLLYFIASGALVFSFRYLYDVYAGMASTSGIEADLYHFGYIGGNIRRLFSFHGLYDVLSNIAIWMIFPVIAFISATFRQALKERLEWYMFFYMLAIFVHLLLSGYFERMFYLTMPLICMFTALSFGQIADLMKERKK